MSKQAFRVPAAEAVILMATSITWGMVTVPRGSRDHSAQRCNKQFDLCCLVTAVAVTLVPVTVILVPVTVLVVCGSHLVPVASI